MFMKYGLATVMRMIPEFIQLKKTNQRYSAALKSFNCKTVEDFIQDYEMLCVVVDDLKDYVEAASSANTDSLERICRLAQNLGVIVLCAGRMADISKYNEIESLTRCIVAYQNGIALGATPAQTAIFNNSLRYNEKDVDLGAGNAYQFVKGKSIKVKLME